MIRFAIALLCQFALVMPLNASPAELPSLTLTIRDQKLVVEVASTPETRATGLMNRFSLRQDHGMLFVFEAPQPLAFYMKNTYIPLSIAFVDTQGRILNIEDMRPLDESTHWSRGVAQYAIEMRQGWFAAKGIGVNLPDSIFRTVDLPARLQESVRVNQRAIGLRVTAESLRIETATLWSSARVQVEAQGQRQVQVQAPPKP